MESVEVTVWKVLPGLDLAIARLQQLREVLITDEERLLSFEYPPGFPPLPNRPVPTFCGGPCLRPTLLEGDEPTSVVVERMAGLIYGIATVVENEL